MRYQIKMFLYEHVPRWSVIYAFVRAGLGRHRLPPGKLVRLYDEEKKNQLFLLERAEQLGPIFKGTIFNEFCVGVMGLERGRRLLRDHAADLQPLTLKLEVLFPKGFLRQMEGEEHRKYRKALVQAIRPEDFTANIKSMEALASRALADYAVEQNAPECSPKTYIAALNRIASGMLIQMFFGTAPDTEPFDRILQSYQKLGPNGLVWNLGEEQKLAFVEIRDYLLELYAAGHPERRPPGHERSIIGRLVNEVALDETMLGNLIYMVEMGRYDTYSLFRWLTKFAAENPAMLERIAQEAIEAKAGEKSFTEAFALETLRMAQSERLTRRARNDIFFEGFLIPKRSFVRVCVWESHKSADVFPEPFRFDPTRFLNGSPGRDEYSAFGLDQHQCPFGDATVKMSVIYLRQLAQDYKVIPTGDATPVRGTHHWEPASRFGVKLEPRGREGTK